MKRLLLSMLSRLPSKLPQGRTEFGKWAASIIKVAGFPDNDSVRFALASMIPQIGPVKSRGLNIPRSYVSKHYFVKGLQQGATNQVAFVIMQELKNAQQAALKAGDESKAI